MAHLARGANSTALAPLLDIWITENGVIADPDDGSLTWSIVNISTDAMEIGPVTVTGPITVNLTTHRIANQTGHFAAVRSPLVPANETVGAHEIRWAWTIDGAPFSYAQRFDVLEGVPRGLGGGYCLVSDLRAEEIGDDAVSDLRLLKLIAQESRFVDRATRRFFEPRFLSFRADGTASPILLLGEPIIALSTVKIADQEIAIDFDSNELVVYNRHLGGLLEPDDRTAPRIQLPLRNLPFELEGTWSPAFQIGQSLRSRFPDYAQNIMVEGLFGYTDPDGTHLGQTPDPIREATMLLVRRKIPTLADTEGQFEAQEGHRTKRIKTRDQELELDGERLSGVITITGDAQIDRLLSLFVRSLRAGSA